MNKNDSKVPLEGKALRTDKPSGDITGVLAMHFGLNMTEMTHEVCSYGRPMSG